MAALTSYWGHFPARPNSMHPAPSNIPPTPRIFFKLVLYTTHIRLVVASA